MGADKRGTYDPIATANDECGKLFKLPFGFCGAIAGTIGYCEPVISELGHRMDGLKENERSVEYIEREMKAALHHIHLGLVGTALMQECAITISQYWHDEKIVSEVRERAQETIRDTHLPVQLIVGGFHQDTSILLWSNELQVWEEVSPGNAVIGSGVIHALNWLGYRRQNIEVSAQRSFMHLVEAKEFSELQKTVGPVAQYVMLTKQGMEPLEGQSDLLKRWWGAYGLQPSDRLDSAEERAAFLGAFGISADTLD